MRSRARGRRAQLRAPCLSGSIEPSGRCGTKHLWARVTDNEALGGVMEINRSIRAARYLATLLGVALVLGRADRPPWRLRVTSTRPSAPAVSRPCPSPTRMRTRTTSPGRRTARSSSSAPRIRRSGSSRTSRSCASFPTGSSTPPSATRGASRPTSGAATTRGWRWRCSATARSSQRAPRPAWPRSLATCPTARWIPPSITTGGCSWTSVDARARDLAIQANGKIVVALDDGWTFSAARLRRNGNLDATFGEAGVLREDFSPGSSDWVRAVALDDAGGILLGGLGVSGCRHDAR